MPSSSRARIPRYRGPTCLCWLAQMGTESILIGLWCSFPVPQDTPTFSVDYQAPMTALYCLARRKRMLLTSSDSIPTLYWGMGNNSRTSAPDAMRRTLFLRGDGPRDPALLINAFIAKLRARPCFCELGARCRFKTVPCLQRCRVAGGWALFLSRSPGSERESAALRPYRPHARNCWHR